MVSSAGLLEVEAGMVGLLVGEETWSLVIGLWFLEAKPGMGSLEKKWRDWCVREVGVVAGERIGVVEAAIGVIRWKRRRRRVGRVGGSRNSAFEFSVFLLAGEGRWGPLRKLGLCWATFCHVESSELTRMVVT
ncbi:hypothetical protein FH972_009007 [Carpinus fangiana]|uniref:Uncharacterized protein n=1 Tax=Carpinus fangiana TaxID=176857 RepID=A0A5N6R2Q4_9ROSI|nr:hypothetical protein FH972_009007 [Carpinus fangiana]